MSPKTKDQSPKSKDDLIEDMLKTFDDLGNSPAARIDAREWAKHYRALAFKLVFHPPKK